MYVCAVVMQAEAGGDEFNINDDTLNC